MGKETNIGYHSRLPQDLGGGGGAGIKTLGLLYKGNYIYLTEEPGSDVKITVDDIPNEPFIAYFHYVNGSRIQEEVAYLLRYDVKNIEGSMQYQLNMLLFNGSDIKAALFVTDENGYFRYLRTIA